MNTNEKIMQWPSDPSHYEWKGTLTQTSNVWKVLAHCKAKKMDVIIEIKKYQANDDEDSLPSIEEFSMRLKTLIHIQHNNLLTPIHSFSFKDEVWTIYPRHSGGVLLELLASHYPNGIHDEHLIAYLLFNVVQGLSYLHKNQSCHRNLRPSSIFFDKEWGITLLSEFGELKTIKFNKQYQQTNSVVSSNREPWTDPLLLIKHPAISWYDGDIYSIGICALHLVFGAPPVHADKLTNSLIRLISKPISKNEINDAEFYNQIGIKSYSNKECMIKSKVFEDFINDCTCALAKRPSIDKLLHHPFFVKKNIYSADTVREKIGHLFQSVESRINAAFSAPISFPNMNSTDYSTIKQLTKLKIDVINNDTQVKNKNRKNSKSEAEWNFSVTPSTTKSKQSFFENEMVENKEQNAPQSQKGRFTVEKRWTNLDMSSDKSDSIHSTDGISNRHKSYGLWTAEDCGKWVAEMGDAYKQYKQIFIDNGIDGEMLKQLDDDLLKEIVPSKLHRAKLISMTKKLYN
eukprot:278964_1